MVKNKGSRQDRGRNAPYAMGALPYYCDYSCPYASFPPSDAVGACRREAGVYCTMLERYNNKNARCLARGMER